MMIRVFENLFPVFALICAGHALRRCEFASAEFLKVSDRLVSFILFPVMLFWKVGGAPLDLASAAIAVSALLSVFPLSAALLM
jgi:predicted permease